MPNKTLSNLRSTTAQELLNRPFKPRQMLLDPWLRTEETCIIWAASGLGKTMLSLSISLAIAGGGKLVDWSAEKPRRVLYVDGEMHAQDIRDRLELLSRSKMGILARHQRKDALENLIFIARQDQDVGAPFYDLTDEKTHREIISRVRKEGVQLVVLDNFTTLSEGLEDENAAAAFKQVQGFLLELKRLGVATLLVHHANKSGHDMRGSTALETTFEVILGLKKPSVPKTGEARFVAEFGKFRGKGDERLQAREWSLAEDGWSITEALPEDPKSDSVYKALKSLRFKSMVEIAKELGVNKSTVSRRIQRLIAHGALKKDEHFEIFDMVREIQREERDGLPDWGEPDHGTETAEALLETF